MSVNEPPEIDFLIIRGAAVGMVKEEVFSIKESGETYCKKVTHSLVGAQVDILLTSRNFEYLQDAIWQLFEKIDYLGLQLDYTLKNINKKDYEYFRKRYIISPEYNADDLKQRILCLRKYLKDRDQVDADHFAMLLGRDVHTTEKLMISICRDAQSVECKYLVSQ